MYQIVGPSSLLTRFEFTSTNLRVPLKGERVSSHWMGVTGAPSQRSSPMTPGV